MKTWQKLLIALGILILILMLIPKSESNEPLASANTTQKQVPLNTPLQTKYFQVTVTDVKISKSVKTGNQFSDLKPEEGNKFVILGITLKNTDNESRMMFEGKLIIDYNGKQYSFEQSEPVFAEGWGITENINPMVTKKTKVVYKIPDEISGTAYYNPARSENDEVIFLGPIK